jgi:hypothetical protein
MRLCGGLWRISGSKMLVFSICWAEYHSEKMWLPNEYHDSPPYEGQSRSLAKMAIRQSDDFVNDSQEMLQLLSSSGPRFGSTDRLYGWFQANWHLDSALSILNILPSCMILTADTDTQYRSQPIKPIR